MIDLNEFATRYIALWNEPDAGARRRAIAELFAPEAAHYTPAQEVHGHAELEERVTTAYEKWVKPGAFAFRAVPNANGHHNAVRFNWEMYSVATDETDSVGFDFIVLDERGLIETDHQFVD
ncbi:nuclear transport factor 2 family protein [Actinacidiphila oryziradicis]|uniref:Nuclear transport factor 2 family protein n=1 Tax=Actinacidiphila oryziradicis TaxID=2571141 RepID=A0A4U0S5A8_9ACTN|nr:nuclear transport factor 2 family protein [Actinacidiphila oryziradicis]TKA03307.1 nuclear transport factor 2 family protein [Actinacidiphila oryziradicis]